MKIKTLGLGCLLSISLMQTPMHAMQDENKQRLYTIGKAIAAVVSISIVAAEAYRTYFASHVLDAPEPDRFIQTTYARLYKKSHAREYLLNVCENNDEIQFISIRFLPRTGLNSTVNLVCPRYLDAIIVAKRNEVNILKQMVLVKTLATEDQPTTLNRSRRGLNQLIEDYEAAASSQAPE